MARLSHPHLVQLYDFGENSGLWYMVQEWIQGKTLFDHQQAGILRIEDGVRLVQEVCAGLRNAHANGVVHRDIKPANILIDHEGSVKLTDFGLAQSVGGEAEGSEEEDSFGTPEYAAPELFVDGAQIDHRADIFAVGVLLYELLTGTQPGENYCPPSEVVDDLNERFDAIVAKAMQHDPENRYQSCAELEEDLSEALNEEDEEEKQEAKASSSRLLTAPVSVGSTVAVNNGLANLQSSKGGGGGLLGVLVGIAIIAGGFWFFLFKDPAPSAQDQEPVKEKDQAVTEAPKGPPTLSDKVAELEQKQLEESKAAAAEEAAEEAAKEAEETVIPEEVAPSGKVSRQRLADRKGPIKEVKEVMDDLKRRGQPQVEKYDAEMRQLRRKYIAAARNAARNKPAGLVKFWKDEIETLRESGMPPENDTGIPAFARKLRAGYRSRVIEAGNTLKLMHIDTVERLELLVKEFRRTQRPIAMRKAAQESMRISTFESFLSSLRQR